MLIAILFGIVARNIGIIHHSLNAGITYSSKKLLRAGVVILGFQLSIPAVIGLGWKPIVIIVLTVGMTFLLTIGVGTIFNMRKNVTILTATGVSICGASAVAGMHAVVSSDSRHDGEEAAATAVAIVTIFGTISMLVLPPIAVALGMSPTAQGTWFGSAIHEVGQVTAAGGFVSQEVLELATVVKLGRVALLAPLVAIMGVVLSRGMSKDEPSPDHHEALKRPPIIPLFVIGFLVMVALNSLVGPYLPHAVAPTLKFISTYLLTAAMFALGCAVDIRSLVRKGGSALALGLFASVVAAVFSLGGIYLLKI